MRNQKKLATLESWCASEESYQPFRWEYSNAINLPIPENYQAFTIDHIPFSSSGKKRFQAVSLEALGALLWLTSRQQLAEKHTMRHYQRLRPCFSERSMQPIHLLTWNQKDLMLKRYNPYNHSMEVIQHPNPKCLRAAYHTVDIQQGELLLLAAESGKASSFIKDREQQRWRDTHIIQGYLSIAAEMLQLEFFSLAITGEDLIYQLDPHGRLHLVGMSVIGESSLVYLDT